MNSNFDYNNKKDTTFTVIAEVLEHKIFKKLKPYTNEYELHYFY